jgi:hypothetical protein
MSLTVEMDEPRCLWEMEITTSPVFTLMSAIGSRIPERAWRSRLLHRVMEAAAKRFLGLGAVRLSGTMPNGQYGVLTPRRLYPIKRSHAMFDGIDLGHTVRSRETPRIGDVPLYRPARCLRSGAAISRLRTRTDTKWAADRFRWRSVGPFPIIVNGRGRSGIHTTRHVGTIMRPPDVKSGRSCSIPSRRRSRLDGVVAA